MDHVDDLRLSLLDTSSPPRAWAGPAEVPDSGGATSLGLGMAAPRKNREICGEVCHSFVGPRASATLSRRSWSCRSLGASEVADGTILVHITLPNIGSIHKRIPEMLTCTATAISNL